MTDDPIRSRPYSTAMACERCCFGRGEHAEYCAQGVIQRYADSRIEAALHELSRMFYADRLIVAKMRAEGSVT